MITKKITMYMNGEEFHSFEFPTYTDDKKVASQKVREAIIKALNGGSVFKIGGMDMNNSDWSNFGFGGDMIKVEDVEW